MILPLSLARPEILSTYDSRCQTVTLVSPPSTTEEITEDVGFARPGPSTLEPLFVDEAEYENERWHYQH